MLKSPSASQACDPKFEVQGSKFQKPRTSDLELSSVLLDPPVSLGHPAG